MNAKIIAQIYKNMLRQKSFHQFIERHSIFLEISKLILEQKPVARFIKPIYERSRKKIEINVTYFCNLKCINCNRSCRQAPSDEYVSVEQIKKFIKESVENNIQWEWVNILGGEPTLHPDIIETVKLLLDYKKNHAPTSKVMLFTNGLGKKVSSILSTLPQELVIVNSAKKSVQQHFGAFNMAPCDLKRYQFVDYSLGCSRISNCGIGLTPYGYYPCSMAGTIDRVFGFNAGRGKLPHKDDSMIDQLELFCRYCGHFTGRRTDKEIITPTWAEAYGKYKIKKPQLTRY